MSQQDLPGNPQHAIEYTDGRAQLGDDSQIATKDVAAAEAQSVAQDAKASASQVAGTAQEQASEVAAEAVDQAKRLFEQLKSEFTGQASGQQQRLAGGLQSLAEELKGMAQGSQTSGVASDVVTQASQRMRSAASFVENREPAEILEEVRRFARQRPGAFLAAAAALGLVAGRLTRGVADEARGQQTQDSSARLAGYPVQGQQQYQPQYGQAQYGQAEYGQTQYGYAGVAPQAGLEGQSPRPAEPGPYAASSESPYDQYAAGRRDAVDPQTGLPVDDVLGRNEDRA